MNDLVKEVRSRNVNLPCTRTKTVKVINDRTESGHEFRNVYKIFIVLLYGKGKHR